MQVEGTTTTGIRYIRTDAKDARIQVGDPTKTWGLATGWATAGDFSIIEEGVSGNRLYIAQGGNVGIGTSSPSTGLDVANGDLQLSATDAKLRIKDKNGIYHYLEPAGDGRSGLVLRTTGNQEEIFQVRSSGQAVRFAVYHTNKTYVQGNLGIGTADPSHKLHVNGTGRIDGELTMQNNKITDLAAPVNANDAASKAYVDAATEVPGENFIRTECYTTSTTFSTAASHTGSGEVKFIQMLHYTSTYGENRPVSVKIIVDGDVTNAKSFAYHEWYPTAQYTDSYYTNKVYHLPVNIKYSSSLEIQMARHNSAVGISKTYVGWTMEQ